ncbi:impaired in BABA-induced sterility 1-like protein, partial [Tanacetum coccineum]
MGCVSSKQAVSVTPAVDHSGCIKDNGGDVVVEMEVKKKKSKHKRSESGVSGSSELGESGRTSCTTNGGGGNGDSVSFRLGNLHKYVIGEQVAAGWPAWLSAVAGEAIQGWVPLRAESFEKLEKVGQGTYSSVFRARELETGRIVALKKVRFDNFEPESVRFMAREIVILRRLDHPNVMKLDGIITSRLSCSIYLVFEYMEHDISGLLSCPDINFTESQIKCYMKQLLEGLEHCHSRGVMHRDIKGANLLVNNEGVMKIGDFGLANFCNSFGEKKQPLTSRVVTLWYRPPELLLGSTDYEASVDLWSIGCVFAELLLGIPILQGRTE